MQLQTKLATAILLGLSTMNIYALPTITGMLDLSLDYLPENNGNGNEDRNVVEIDSNASYIGVKGDEKLNDRFNVLYVADWGISTNRSSTAQTFTNRNLYIGIQDKVWGTVRIGQQDTPLKALSSSVDSFNNRIENKLDVNGIMAGETRITDSLFYQSPEFNLAKGKLKFGVLTATGEASGAERVSGAAKVSGRGFGDSISTSVVYTQPTFMLGVAYDKAIPNTFASSGILNASSRNTSVSSVFAVANTVRVVGRVNVLDNLAVKALYQTSDFEDKQVQNETTAQATRRANLDNAQGWLLGVEYKLPQHKGFTVKGQYSQNTTSYKSGSDFEAKQIALGVDYALHKQVNTYAQLGYLTLEQGSDKDKQSALGVGIEYKF